MVSQSFLTAIEEGFTWRNRHPREPLGMSPEEEDEEVPIIHSDEESDESEGASDDEAAGSSDDASEGVEDEDEDGSEDDGSDEEEESGEEEDSLDEAGAGAWGKAERARGVGADAAPSVSGASSDEELDQAMLDLVAGKQSRRSRHVQGAEAATRRDDAGEAEAGDPWDSAEGDLEDVEGMQEATDERLQTMRHCFTSLFCLFCVPMWRLGAKPWVANPVLALTLLYSLMAPQGSFQ